MSFLDVFRFDLSYKGVIGFIIMMEGGFLGSLIFFLNFLFRGRAIS